MNETSFAGLVQMVEMGGEACTELNHIGETGGEDGNNQQGANTTRVNEPYEGQIFSSRQVLEKFLDAHGKSVGFQWRTRSSRKDGANGEFCAARYVCSKEGKRKPRGANISHPEPTTREGCKAAKSSTRQKSGDWKINKTRLEHNHETDACSSRFLCRYRSVPVHLKYRLLTNQRSGIGVGRTYSSFLVEKNGIENLQALERGCRNYIWVERSQLITAGDDQAAMEYFGKMQVENEIFFYLPYVDKEGRLTNLFWADARSWAA